MEFTGFERGIISHALDLLREAMFYDDAYTAEDIDCTDSLIVRFAPVDE